MSTLLAALSGAGAALDTPGAVVRNTLAGRNPLLPLLSPFDWEDRVTGRELLSQYGLAGDDPTGANMAGGYLAEFALDPLTWGGVGALARGLGMGARGARAAGAAGRAGRAAAPATGRAMAMSVAPPAVGAYLIGENMRDPEGAQDWKNWVGTGLMLSPLAMALGRGAGRKAAAARGKKAADTLQQRVQKMWSEGMAPHEIAQTLAAEGVKGPRRGQVTYRTVESMARKFPDTVKKAREQALATGAAHASSPYRLVPPWVTTAMSADDVMVQGVARDMTHQHVAELLNHMGFRRPVKKTAQEHVYEAMLRLGGASAKSADTRRYLRDPKQVGPEIARYFAQRDISRHIDRARKMLREGKVPQPEMPEFNRDTVFRRTKDPEFAKRITETQQELAAMRGIPLSQRNLIGRMGTFHDLSPELQAEATRLVRPQRGPVMDAENLQYIRNLQARGLKAGEMVKSVREAGITDPVTGRRFTQETLAKFLHNQAVRPTPIAGALAPDTRIKPPEAVNNAIGRLRYPKRANQPGMLSVDDVFGDQSRLNDAMAARFGEDRARRLSPDTHQNLLGDAYSDAVAMFGSDAGRVIKPDEVGDFMDYFLRRASKRGLQPVIARPGSPDIMDPSRKRPEGRHPKTITPGAEVELDIRPSEAERISGARGPYTHVPPTAQEMAQWDQRIARALDTIEDSAIRERVQQWLNEKKLRMVRGSVEPWEFPQVSPGTDEATAGLLRQLMSEEGLEVAGQRLRRPAGPRQQPGTLSEAFAEVRREARRERGPTSPDPETAMRDYRRAMVEGKPPTLDEDPAGVAERVVRQVLQEDPQQLPPGSPQGVGQLTPEQTQELVEVIRRNAPQDISPQLVAEIEKLATRYPLPTGILDPPPARDVPPLSGETRYVPGTGLEGEWRPVEQIGQPGVERRAAQLRGPVDPKAKARERLAPGMAVDPQTVRQYMIGEAEKLRGLGLSDEQMAEMLRYLVALLGLTGAGGAAAGRFTARGPEDVAAGLRS